MAIPSSLLRDRVVVITGASQGIGRGIALGCAQAGARVVVHHLGTEAALQDARSLLQEIERIASTRQGDEVDAGTAAAAAAAIEVGGDISDPATADRIVAAALAAYGRIDGLVSNAGICPFYSFLDIPHAAWEKTRSVNLDGAFYVVQAVARQMSQQQEPKGGSIVAVSSISALAGGGQQACVSADFLFLSLSTPDPLHSHLVTLPITRSIDITLLQRRVSNRSWSRAPSRSVRTESDVSPRARALLLPRIDMAAHVPAPFLQVTLYCQVSNSCPTTSNILYFHPPHQALSRHDTSAKSFGFSSRAHRNDRNTHQRTRPRCRFRQARLHGETDPARSAR